MTNNCFIMVFLLLFYAVLVKGIPQAPVEDYRSAVPSYHGGESPSHNQPLISVPVPADNQSSKTEQVNEGIPQASVEDYRGGEYHNQRLISLPVPVDNQPSQTVQVYEGAPSPSQPSLPGEALTTQLTPESSMIDKSQTPSSPAMYTGFPSIQMIQKAVNDTAKKVEDNLSRSVEPFVRSPLQGLATMVANSDVAKKFGVNFSPTKDKDKKSKKAR